MIAPSRFVVLLLLTATHAFAKPPAEREAEFRALSVAPADGGVAGRAIQVTARISPNKRPTPAIGIVGASSSASGDQWLPTLWRAAFVATEAAGSKLSEFEISLRVDEPIDGPSAGMLTATTLVALLRGKKPLPRTAVIGALNPDGSIGPVDELLPRLRAAAADGVKRFGFPSGSRQQLCASGVVDVGMEAQRLGMTAQELGTLDDAYLFLTGEALTRPAPAREADMELWPAELAALAQRTTEVRGEFETERVAFEGSLDGGTPPVRQRLERAAKQASDFERSGDAVRALVVWSSALTLVRAATEAAQLTRLLEKNDVEAVAAQVQRLDEAVATERLQFRKEIDGRFPNTTRVNDLYAMDLLESIAAQGTGPASGERVTTLRALAPKDPAFAKQARQFVDELVRGREDVKNGRRFFAMYAALPELKKVLPPLDAERLASSYAAAGAASYASLQSRFTDSMRKDETAAEVANAEMKLRSENDARARLVLAARQHIYSAYLSNTYVGLGAVIDQAGVFSVPNARALTVQLELAKLRTLQSCGHAKRDGGMIPFAARLRFLNARAAREGTDRQKTEALAELWIASWWCELAVERTERAKPH